MSEQGNVLPLAAIRKNRGITLEQISNITKIGIRLLQAIESCDFGKLPGGIYDTNYIRQYARVIDFDESEILAVYRRARGGEAQPDKSSRGTFSSFRPASTIG